MLGSPLPPVPDANGKGKDGKDGKVEGCPGFILFGPYSSDQEAEVHIVMLK